jgi:hypothetical protein
MGTNTVRRIGIAVLLLSLAALPLRAQSTLYVDDDAPNDPGPGDPIISDPLEDGSVAHPFDAIQEGIDHAVNGNTVMVRDGTYSGTGNYSINFSGKAILVSSENGAESCDIDGDGPTAGGVVFENGEGNDSILRGFTIHNIHFDCGYFEDHSPIHIVGASPTIENNIIRDNWYEYHCVAGLAIHCENSSAVLQDNLILDNYAGGSCDGTIHCRDSNLTILSNTIHGNGILEHGKGAGIYCDNSSVEIVGNVITDNYIWSGGQGWGGGICCIATSALIAGNTISGNKIWEGGKGVGIYCQGASPVSILDNLISGNNKSIPFYVMVWGTLGAGIYCECDAVIAGNIITDNSAYSYCDGYESCNGGKGAGIYCGSGSPTIVNNFIAGNGLWLDHLGDYYSPGYGGGLYCGPDTSPVISNNTIIDNYCDGYSSESYGVGIYCDSSSAVIANCIIRGNENEQIGGCDGLVGYSNVEGGYPGTGNIDADPIFAKGPDGCYYLSQAAAGQPVTSTCVDSGSGPAALICFEGVDGVVCLDDLTTRTDQVTDSGTVDMGYHHGGGAVVPCPATVSTDYTCQPGAGTLPYSTSMSVTLENLYPGASRRLAGRIHVTVGGGGYFANWRAGFTNVAAGNSYSTTWSQNIPALGSLIGDNVFKLVAEDVTPAPYNQPPYPPSGDSDSDACTVTGIAP